MKNKERIAVGGLIFLTAALNLILLVSARFSPDPPYQHYALCAAIDLTAVACLLNRKDMLRLPRYLCRERDVIWALVKNDFRARFAGSYLGVFWAFFQPVITIVLYWFVFQVGLRSGNMSDHPFILFLMSGLVPWFYFSEAWMGASNSLLEYNYLVKKVRFNVEILPVLKVCSALFVHLFFVGVVVLMCVGYGYGIDLYLLQLPYYTCALALLATGLSYITAAFTVFFRDMSQIVNIILTMGIWLTPIMWNPAATMSLSLQKIFKLNPVYYVVAGFRDALLEKLWFWEKPAWSVYFWCICAGIYLIGTKVFNRLKTHFSDVL